MSAVRACARSLQVAALFALGVLLDCANLPTLTSGSCGDGVVDPPKEDCDGFPVDAGAGKKVETWVVETPTKLYGRMTWWVRKEPPYVIKAVLEVPEKEDGSGRVAAIITYTMV